MGRKIVMGEAEVMGDESMLLVTSLGNIIVSWVYDWTEWKPWQNLSPDDFWTWLWSPTLIWHCTVPQYRWCHLSGRISQLVREEGSDIGFLGWKGPSLWRFQSIWQDWTLSLQIRQHSWRWSWMWAALSSRVGCHAKSREHSLILKSSGEVLHSMWSTVFGSPCASPQAGPQ